MKAVLTLNSGSSSIKFSVFAIENNQLRRKFSGLVDSVNKNPIMKIKTEGSNTKVEQRLNDLDKNTHFEDPFEKALHDVLDWLNQHNIDIVAAGHRVAHGGTKFRAPVKITSEVVEFLRTLTPLAPLHQPYNVNGSEVLKAIDPNLFQVACFDTSFHTTCNELSQHFALPVKMYDEGIRRYGFHGLSYEFIVSQFDKYLTPEQASGRVIIAHLGAGASMCAVKNKISVATTLSFSALDGLPMGTRCGNIDPGVLLYFMHDRGMGYAELMQLLYKESGLLGLSGGISSDMRELEESSAPDARLAIDVFCYKIGAWIGMLAAELEGLDGIIFTAGIGEHSALVREKVCKYAEWLGAKIDPEMNSHNGPCIHADDSKLFIYAQPTDEESTIAKYTFQLYQQR